jgi:eukaryotic-like serine/threonine-protein kinase
VTPSSPPIAPGTAVGPYVVERRLAQGSVGVVYVARDGRGAAVALKAVAATAPNGGGRARVAREARALGAIAHSGVVRAYGTGEHQGTPWIAKEYVAGVDLKHLLADRGPMRSDAAVRYAALLAEAVAATHQAGVIHRDLQPSGIVVTVDSRVVVVDFGLAKRKLEPRESDVPAVDREALGAPAYLSPEQIEHGLADERSDIWALGCVLYEMIAGTPPFGRGGASTTASILRDEPSIPDGIGSAGDIISACLRKSSFARVASARALGELLHAALDGVHDDRGSGESRSWVPPAALASARPARSSAPPPPDARPSAPPSVRLPAASRPPSVPPPRPRLSSSPSSRPPARSSSSFRAAPPQGRIKGAAVRAALVWFSETYGNAACARVLERASLDLQSMLRPGDNAYGVIASTWYETTLVGELVEIVESVAADDDVEEYRSRMAAAVAKDNVSGVYRSLFRLVATPPLLEANAQRVWGTYCNEGAFVVRVVRPGAFEARLRGWSAHHPALCALGSHLLEQFLRTIGYNGLVVERTQCVSNEDGQCVFEGTWLA